MPLRSAVELAIEVCHGLEAAHARSVVHCDLKPDNLFLTADGRVKILDFGIARLTRPSGRDPADTDTKPGLLMGTVGYLSPEQARGLAPDGRADLFALGAILYEALSGRRAFAGASAADTIAAVLHDDPPPLRIVLGPLPSMLDRVVRRCLHKDRDERFHSAHDLALALEAVLDRPLPGGGPVAGERGAQPLPRPAARSPRRTRAASSVVRPRWGGSGSGCGTSGCWASSGRRARARRPSSGPASPPRSPPAGP